MVKKVLIIHGHTLQQSYVNAVSDAYKKGALSAGAEVKELKLASIKFGDFIGGFGAETPPDIIQAQNLIGWANHLVWVFPIWWYSMPAVMKTFIEHTFLPGFSFKYAKIQGEVKIEKLLSGKSCRIMATMDSTPAEYVKEQGEPGYHIMKNTMNFMGISPVEKTYLGSVKRASDELRQEWLEETEALGRQLI